MSHQANLLTALRQLQPGCIGLFTDSDTCADLRIFHQVASAIGWRFAPRAFETSVGELHGCIVVRRISAFDPQRPSFVAVRLANVVNPIDAGRFISSRLADVLDPDPPLIEFYPRPTPAVNEASMPIPSTAEPRGKGRSVMSSLSRHISSIGATPDFDDELEDNATIDCNGIPAPTPKAEAVATPAESDTQLDDDKKLWIDRLSALVLQYVSQFHEAPPMHLIEQEIRGKLQLRAANLSALRVNGDMRIFLPDFNEMELRMTPLARTLYLLFLRHTEGIRLKDMPQHLDELAEIYSLVKPGADEDLAKASIAELADPLGDSLQQKLSMTRKAVRRQILDPKIADSYLIKGSKGGIYRINLPTRLISLHNSVADLPFN